jgi:hypothetical protein
MDPIKTFDEIWNDAVEQYLRSTSRSSKDRDRYIDVQNPEELFRRLESSQRVFSTWRGRNSKFINTLKRIMQPCAALSAIAQSSISLTPFAPASTVLGAVLFLVEAANGVSEAYDWIEALFNKLGAFTQRLEQYMEAGMTPHLEQKVVSILSCLLELVGRSEAVIKEGRFRRYTGSTFLGRADDVKILFDQLDDLFEEEVRLVQATEYAAVTRIDKRTRNIEHNAVKASDATIQMASALEGGLDSLRLLNYTNVIIKTLQRKINTLNRER